MSKIKPQVGNQILCDGWAGVERLIAGDDYVDSGFPGCQFRIKPRNEAITLAVNVVVTGKPHWAETWTGNTAKSRCKIEFVGDGEPSIFIGGWLFHIHDQREV